MYQVPTTTRRVDEKIVRIVGTVVIRHPWIECLDSKSGIKNVFGFRACNFQHSSLASGRVVFSSCGADPSRAKTGCPRLFALVLVWVAGESRRCWCWGAGVDDGVLSEAGLGLGLGLSRAKPGAGGGGGGGARARGRGSDRSG
jgi:hypothetical protein